VDSEPSILFRNNHDGTFTAVIAGCAYSDNGREQAGMGVAVGDYDCDGWFDPMQINGHVYPEIEGHATGQPTRTRAWSTTTWAMDSSRTFPRNWARAPATDTPAAARPSRTATTTGTKFIPEAA